MKRNRAYRREKSAKIKKKLISEYEKWLNNLNLDPRTYRKDWYTDNRKLQILRSYLCNEGKSRSYFCKCEWCLSNKTYSDLKQKERLNQEYFDFFRNGVYIGPETEDILPRFRSFLVENKNKDSGEWLMKGFIDNMGV